MNRFFKIIAIKIRKFEKLVNEYKIKSGSSGNIPYLTYVNWGISLSNVEDLDDAIDKLETSVMMQPNSVSAHLQLGQVYMKKERYEDAINQFKKSIRLDNKSALAYSFLAAALVLTDEYRDAEKYYKKASNMKSACADVHNNYATALARKGKKYKAVEIYKAALKLDDMNFFALHCSGVLLCNLEKYDEAEINLKKALDIEPENPDTLAYMAICLQKLGRINEAYDIISKCLSIRNNFMDAQICKGMCLAELGKEAECIACFNDGFNKGFMNAVYYTYWGIALQKFARYPEAKEKFLSAFERDRDNTLMLFHLGLNYLKEGNSTPALQIFEKLVDIDSKNAAAWEKIGEIKFVKAEYLECIDDFQSAMKASRKYTHLYYKIAKAYYNLDDLKNSEAYFIKAMDYDSENISAYVDYAELEMQLGKDQEALRKIRTAYKKNPDSFDVISMYSRILVKMNMLHDALEKLDKLIELDKDYYEATYTKAEVLNSLKKPQEAIGLLQSLPSEIQDSKDFLYLSMISYNNLAQLTPSHYNISKAIDFCNRLTDKYGNEEKIEDLRSKLKHILETVEGN